MRRYLSKEYLRRLSNEELLDIIFTCTTKFETDNNAREVLRERGYYK